MEEWWRDKSERAGFSVQPGEMQKKERIWNTFKFFEIKSNGLGSDSGWKGGRGRWEEWCWITLTFEVICEHMMEAIESGGMKGKEGLSERRRNYQDKGEVLEQH